MKKNIRYNAALCSLLAAITLAGCSGNNAPAQESSAAAAPAQSTADSTSSDTAVAAAEAQTVQPEETQETAASGSMCGTAYIGFIEPESDKQACREKFLASEYAEMFFSIGDIPDDHIASSDGGMDLFLVIPGGGCKAIVYTWDMTEENDFAGEKGEAILNCDDGAPFLLKCNRSDIMPDTLVEITDSDGNTYEWKPGISMKDGTVLTGAGDMTVYDFTEYDFEIIPD
ncbi:MAG: hypothetical protein ACI4WS_02540 [Oscillospiraceae bacterium]